MKPRLYEQNEMLFEGGGICTLHDAVSCEVEEELNGAFELKMKYPVSGDAFTQLKTGRMILAKPSAWEKPEPFHIYAISKPLMGLVTVYAEHVSYFTNKIVCAPFSASNIAEAVLMLQHSAVNENPFTLSTDMAVVNDLHSSVPITMRHGIIGRIVSLYGGEVKCEGWNIRILGMRGADRGFSIRYGNNLVDMKQDEDISGIYDGVYPYYNVEETEETDAVYVELPEKVILLGTHSERIKPINLTAEFTEEPTEEELRAKTLEYLEKNDINAGVLTIEVEFALLSQTEEYRDIMALEDVRLGDVISVFVPKRGITVKSRCVKTVYDVMRNRYVKVTIGDIGKDITYSFISYEDRLLSSETRIGEQGATIAKLTVKTSAMSAEISGIAEWIGDEDSGMTKTIATLSAKADANAAEIALNAQKITENSTSIASLVATAAEHTALLSGHTEQISDHTEAIADTKQHVNELNATVATITEWIGDETKGAVKALTEVYQVSNANTAAITSITSWQDGIDESVARLWQETDANGAKIGMVVKSGALGDYVDGSVLIEAINGEAVAKIKADRIILDGYLTIGSNISDLTNDSGYATQSDIPTKTSELTNDSGLAYTSQIPTKTSELTNDSGYVGYWAIPTALSDLTNDTGYQTEDGVVSIVEGTITADYIAALGIAAVSLVSRSLDNSNLVYIKDGEFLMSQNYNNQAFSATLCAAFFNAYHPMAGKYFFCGNANATAAAEVGWSTSHRIHFSAGNAQLIGTWLGTSSQAVTSDAGKKHDITDMDDRYSAFFDAVRPVAYRYNDGTSGRYHTGFIANEVEEALASAGISTNEFAGFVRAEMMDKDGETETVNCLRYEEFIAVLWREVQRIKKVIQG